MEQDKKNINQTKSEEVNLIHLLDYFKNGIKSFFKKIGKLFGWVILFILLLRKNWILVGALVLLGGLYGIFKKYQMTDNDIKHYEFIIKGNPLSNMELYSLAKEINSNDTISLEESVKLANKLNIEQMSIEPIIRDEDVINNYFEQIESNVFRSLPTDTLYFQAFDIKAHNSKLLESDYSLQKIKLTIKKGKTPALKVQNEILGYLKNSHKIKTEQDIRVNLLTNHENQIKRAVDNIDSLMVARTIANRNMTVSGNDQMMVNTANRNNLERDLLEAYDLYTKKLYSVQMVKASYENSFSLISTIRSFKESSFLSNPIFRFPVLGFILASLIVLILQFNQYLTRYEQKHKS